MSCTVFLCLKRDETFDVGGYTLLVHVFSTDRGKFKFHCQWCCTPRMEEEVAQWREATLQASIKVVSAVLRSKGRKRVEIESGLYVTPADEGMSIEDFSRLVETALKK